MELVQMLASQLGISEEQAQGGSGLLFKMAKEKLGAGDFSQVASAVPDVENLISSAPEAGGVLSVLGGLASSLGGGAGQLGNLASLASGFRNLNLDSGMVGKFIPIVMSFVQSKGGDTVKSILDKVLTTKLPPNSERRSAEDNKGMTESGRADRCHDRCLRPSPLRSGCRDLRLSASSSRSLSICILVAILVMIFVDNDRNNDRDEDGGTTTIGTMIGTKMDCRSTICSVRAAARR